MCRRTFPPKNKECPRRKKSYKNDEGERTQFSFSSFSPLLSFSFWQLSMYNAYNIFFLLTILFNVRIHVSLSAFYRRSSPAPALKNNNLSKNRLFLFDACINFLSYQFSWKSVVTRKRRTVKNEQKRGIILPPPPPNRSHRI